MKFVVLLIIANLLLISSTAEGWNFLLPRKQKKAKAIICRKTFLIGTAAAATGAAAVLGPATAATALVAINNNNSRAKKTSSSSVYEPEAGSLAGQVILITGASTGLGLESAKRLAAAGATVVMTSRTESKGSKAVQEVEDYLTEKGIGSGDSSAKIYNLVLDLDNLASVKSFAASYKKLGLGEISVLLNNAGVMAIPDRQLTTDGYERTFQSNHLGHFVLTSELFPFLSREKATVINVSSEAYQFAASGLDVDNLQGEKNYGPWSSYGQSKLSNILFTRELQRRAAEAGCDSWLSAVTLHPGAVSTDLGRYIVGEEKWAELKSKGPSGLESLALGAASVFTKTVPEGASTQIFLAAGADGDLKQGAFYENMKEKKNLPAFATDRTAAKQLWEKSEELAGITFDLQPARATTLEQNSEA